VVVIWKRTVGMAATAFGLQAGRESDSRGREITAAAAAVQI
jgi:hypothetical protein